MSISIAIRAGKLVGLWINLQALEERLKLFRRQFDSTLGKVRLEPLDVENSLSYCFLIWNDRTDVENLLRENILSRVDAHEIINGNEAGEFDGKVAVLLKAGILLSLDRLDVALDEFLRCVLIVRFKTFELIMRYRLNVVLLMAYDVLPKAVDGFSSSKEIAD